MARTRARERCGRNGAKAARTPGVDFHQAETGEKQNQAKAKGGVKSKGIGVDFHQAETKAQAGTKQQTDLYQAGSGYSVIINYKQQTDFYQAGIGTGVKKLQHKDGEKMALFGGNFVKTRLTYSVYTNYEKQTDFYQDGIEQVGTKQGAKNYQDGIGTDFYQAGTKEQTNFYQAGIAYSVFMNYEKQTDFYQTDFYQDGIEQVGTKQETPSKCTKTSKSSR